MGTGRLRFDADIADLFQAQNSQKGHAQGIDYTIPRHQRFVQRFQRQRFPPVPKVLQVPIVPLWLPS